MKKLSFVVLPFLALAACSSNKVSLNEPAKFDKPLNSATTDSREKVGVKDNTVVIQKKVYLEEDLSKEQSEIVDLENAIYGRSKQDPGGLWASLQKCRQNVSDPRIGGTGMAEAMEKWEKPSEKDDDFNYAVDDKNNVVAVSEEQLGARVANLQKSKHILRDRFDSFTEKLDVCENKYRAALIQRGINPEDMKAQGEWVDGVWKMRRAATSDPEELMKRKAAREAAQKSGGDQ